MGREERRRPLLERLGTGRAGRSSGLPVLLVVAGFALALALAGCGGRSPSTLDPRGTGADRVAGLWWLLFWISAAVFALVTALIVYAVLRRSLARVQARPGGDALVIVGGVLLPAVVLMVVYAVGLRDMVALANHPGERLTVQVIGHEWWWEVRYPAQGVVTANELHVPTGERVRIELTSADVIHSFWVPQLTVKTDMVPGRVNETWIQAKREGTYPSALRGQCAEYCGLQHANMAFVVVADEPGAFQSWLEEQRRPAAEPATGSAANGRRVFERNSCAACHTLAGTSARGRLGPDLTHFGGRRAIGAGTLPNTPDNLAQWIADSQAVKPGNRMPAQPLTPEQLRALVAYLESLK